MSMARVTLSVVVVVVMGMMMMNGVYGEVMKTLTVNGVSRTYAIYNSGAIKAQSAILLYLHGYGGSCKKSWEAGVLASKVQQMNVPVLVVAMCGVSNAWFSATDNDFVKNLIPVLARDYTADSKKVFVSGFSQGAVFSEVFACNNANLVLGAASVAGGCGALNNPYCTKVSRPISLVKVQGLSDSMTLGSAGPDYTAWFKTLNCSATSNQNSNLRTGNCQQNQHIQYTLVPGQGHGFIESNNPKFSTAENWLTFIKTYFLDAKAK